MGKLTAGVKRWFKDAVAEGNARGDAIVAGDSFAGVWISNGRIHHKDRSVALAGALAVVETAGSIQRRGGAFVAAGGFGVFLPGRKVDNRELFLYVQGTDGVIVAEPDPGKESRAREFVSYLNTRAAEAG
ncbi:hypothetical protein [Amycolatopsis sp. CA-128772]|uniref:hypothetical protein n=1 Tax=Amycolatopsis sp. CA-128772 TaxID=2073159 RepID=UPI0011B0F3A3|nr:hypothetical protein [Amycolatopsis sp. CA-128772]